MKGLTRLQNIEAYKKLHTDLHQASLLPAKFTMRKKLLNLCAVLSIPFWKLERNQPWTAGTLSEKYEVDMLLM